MKKVILIVTVILGIVIAVLTSISPSEFSVEKKLVIDRPVEVVFFSLKNIKAHSSWSPWTRKDRNIKYEYIGQDGTAGFIARWKGNSEVGVGEEEIKRIIEGERIDLEIRFLRPMKDTRVSYFITKDVYEGKAEVTWGMKGPLTFPANISFFIFSTQKKLGYDFDEGLRVLKAILEKDSEKEEEEKIRLDKESIKESIQEISDELKK